MASAGLECALLAVRGAAWLLKGICSTCQSLKEPSLDPLLQMCRVKEMLVSSMRGRHLLDAGRHSKEELDHPKLWAHYGAIRVVLCLAEQLF